MTTQKGSVLVIGATGNQGGQVARALLETGWRVHALTRNPTSQKAQTLKAQGAHLLAGDMGNLPTLIETIQHTDGVFSVQNFWDLGLKEEVRLGTNVIRAAINAGNHPHIVYSSGLGAETRQNVAAIDGKAIIEEQLRNSGLPFTILRPGLFMDDFLGASLPFARPIQKRLETHRPLVGRLFLASLRAVVPASSRIPVTTLRDIGRVARWTFEHPAIAQGLAYTIVGSSEPTKTMCELWNQVTGAAIPRIPGFKHGIHLFHPRMANLLEWLERSPTTITSEPVRIQT